ncbi:amidohydrolase [Sporolactobacillus shoreicorticis]|uniref:Amidohydrolase n=1 Tax=Sporolactobacillus shoreicorticis TaxID=1923877 RepID=A0ABW5S3D2_9BACL|nr:amidohydrolase [Sporolactobacillus shoreicorticis]MCO7124359.1 amidohydrolase [Sporolactobacillus shoreicorticis]
MSTRDNDETAFQSIFKVLHQHPELSLHEYETTTKIRNWLQEQSITLRETGLPTGVFAEISGDPEGPVVGLRADIDALPIHEQTDLPYKSQNEGVMHACGHDFHTTALLWTAELLKKDQAKLSGSVRLIFQPAEEAGHGGLKVIKDGQLKGLDAVIGIHNKPDLPVGTIGIKAGPLMAACDKFKITFQGIGGHAAIPERTRDPIIAASSFVQTAQTIVSRNVSPKHEAVISITSIHGGDVWNVLPGEVELLGTVRTFYDQDRDLIIDRFTAIAEGLQRAHNVQIAVEWGQGTPSVFNDEKIAQIVREANENEAQVVTPEVSVAGDDFSCFQREVPGVFAFVGSNGPEDWHHPAFQVDPKGIRIAAEFYYRSAVAVLKALKSRNK